VILTTMLAAAGALLLALNHLILETAR